MKNVNVLCKRTTRLPHVLFFFNLASNRIIAGQEKHRWCFKHILLITWQRLHIIQKNLHSATMLAWHVTVALSYSSNYSSEAQVKELCHHTSSSDESNLVQGTVEGSVSWRSSDVPSEHIGNKDESECSCNDSADFIDYTSNGASEYSRDGSADSND